MSSTHKWVRRVVIVLGVGLMVFGQGDAAFAFSEDERNCASDYCPTFSPDGSLCSVTGTVNDTAATPDTFLPQVKQAKTFILQQTRALGLYQQIANQTNVPWQMLAAVQYREHTNKIQNSDHTFAIFYQGHSMTVSEGAWGLFGDNITKALDEGIDLTPNKNLSDSDFIKQGVLAANILRDKANGKNLTKTSNTFDVIGYTFFGYNGRAQVYIDQAKKLGFSDADAQNGAGSPYVTNFLTQKQSPSNPQWGQILTDGGGLSYPANQQIGTWTLFAALAGVSVSDNVNCSVAGVNGNVANLVALLLRVRLGVDLGTAQKLGYVPSWYSGAWCAAFATQMYKNAGLKIPGGNNGIYTWAADPIRLTYKYPTQFEMINPFAGGKPAPGDFIEYADHPVTTASEWNSVYNTVIHASDGEEIQHVGIVVQVSGNKITTVEGNTGNGVTGKNTYTYTPGTHDDWVDQIFGFVRMR